MQNDASRMNLDKDLDGPLSLGERQVQTYQPHRDEPETLGDFL
jgi:hypothetical protein